MVEQCYEEAKASAGWTSTRAGAGTACTGTGPGDARLQLPRLERAASRRTKAAFPPPQPTAASPTTPARARAAAAGSHPLARHHQTTPAPPSGRAVTSEVVLGKREETAEARGTPDGARRTGGRCNAPETRRRHSGRLLDIPYSLLSTPYSREIEVVADRDRQGAALAGEPGRPAAGGQASRRHTRLRAAGPVRAYERLGTRRRACTGHTEKRAVRAGRGGWQPINRILRLRTRRAFAARQPCEDGTDDSVRPLSRIRAAPAQDHGPCAGFAWLRRRGANHGRRNRGDPRGDPRISAFSDSAWRAGRSRCAVRDARCRAHHRRRVARQRLAVPGLHPGLRAADGRGDRAAPAPLRMAAGRAGGLDRGPGR